MAAGVELAIKRDALLRIEQAAEVVGVRAVLVHALDVKARDFYQRYGFSASPIDELHLMLLMKDLRAFLHLRPSST
jgi:hypothetical protein